MCSYRQFLYELYNLTQNYSLLHFPLWSGKLPNRISVELTCDTYVTPKGSHTDIGSRKVIQEKILTSYYTTSLHTIKQETKLLDTVLSYLV